ncbi:hypothetical protein YH62_16885 [Rhizobium sp. LC145]|nr:hypothetical protein YH62_16885 [Rhizobium sp. LC145]
MDTVLGIAKVWWRLHVCTRTFSKPPLCASTFSMMVGQARHINMIVAVDHVLAEKRFPPEGQLWTTPVFAKRFAAVG